MEKFNRNEWKGKFEGKWADMAQWSVDNDECGTYSYVGISAGEDVICIVVQEGCDDSEMEANAHLISKSKAMYELLKAISESNCRTSEFYDEISNLLSQARGEQ